MKIRRFVSFFLLTALVISTCLCGSTSGYIYSADLFSDGPIVIDANTDNDTLKALGLEGQVVFEQQENEAADYDSVYEDDIDADFYADEIDSDDVVPSVYPSNDVDDAEVSTKAINPDVEGVRIKATYTHAEYKVNDLEFANGEKIYASTYNGCDYFYIDEKAVWTINGIVYLSEPVKIVSSGHLHILYGKPNTNGEVKFVKEWDTGMSDNYPMFIVEAGGQLTISGKAGEGVLNSSVYSSNSDAVDNDRLILTGNDTGVLDLDQGPIIRCEAGEGETKLKLYGVEFRNNRNATVNSGNGGAIRLSASFGTDSNNLIINKCRFNNIEAKNGGAIYFSQTFSNDGNSVDRTGSINLQNNVFYKCVATDRGGAIMFGSAAETSEKNKYSSVDLSGSYFSKCTATNSGGGICFLGYSGLNDGVYGSTFNGTINLDNCQFQTCVSDNANGGGFTFLARCNNMTVNNAVFNNCSAGGGGSAIYLGEESVINNLTVTGTNFTNNKGATDSKNYGGTFRTVGLASINATLTNCTFSGNTSIDGAGIYWNSGRRYNGTVYNVLEPSLTIDGCSIHDNTATGSGGGIYNESKLIITNTNIYSNEARDGAGICMRNYNHLSGYLPSNLSMTLDSTTQIYSNDASVDGGGICFILRDSAMESSSSYVAGVVIPLKLVLTGAKIYSNTATNNGGGISFRGETGADKFYAFDIELNSGSIYSNSATHGGGIHAIATDRVINVVVNGGVIGGSGTPNRASNQGGGVCLGNSYITLEMSNGEISYNTATTGGGVYSNQGDVKLDGGLIHHNAVTGAGGGALIHGGTATITGGQMYSNSALNGGGMYIRTNAVVTMTGGIIGGDDDSYANYTHATDSNEPTKIGEGGGIYLYNAATFTMNGGSIKYNHSGKHGGGIYCNSAVAVMNDGSVIDHNVADSNGGGIYARIEHNTANISRVCTVTYNGGSVSYNSSTSNGGGIYVENGTVDFYGGNIEWNTTKYGGGLYTNNNAIANLKDDVSISHNTATQSGGGIYATLSSKVTVENGKINNNTASVVGGGVRVAENSEFTLKGGTVNGNVCNGDSIAQTGGGGIYAVGTTKTVDGVITQLICTLTIEGGEISGNTTNYTGTTEYELPLANGVTALYSGGGLFIAGLVTFIMTGGIISDNTTNRIGGGIFIRNNTAPLSGGTVGGTDISTGNEAVYGGGIYACKNSTITLTGGAVTYNTASESGGGIYAEGKAEDTRSSVELSGGNVANNVATNGNGGGIYASYATVSLPTLDGKTANVCDNTANQSGGGIYAITGSVINLSGGDVYNNNAINGDGGGIYATNDAAITLDGGDIYYNHAELGRGGGIFALGAEASVSINGGNVGLSDYPNIANYGGGVYIDSAQFVLEKTETSTGSISYNVAIVDGGGGYFYNTDVNIKGNVSHNEARGSGGGIYLNSADVNLFGDLTNNKSVSVVGLRAAVGSGGGAYLTNGATLEIAEGGNITNNTTDGNGGGIAVYDRSTAKLNGGVITNNSADTGFGGGVYANGSTVAIAGSDITANSAKNGGGVCATAGGVLTMTGGYLRYNTAVGSPDASVKTAYHLDGTLAGVGGGIYLSNGVDANLMSSYELTGQTYGIYGNLADFAADDVFANGVNTRLYLPAALSMKLEGTEYERATGWFEDYANDDIEYENETALRGNISVGGERYRTAERTVIAYISAEDAGNNAPDREVFINTENAYVCLTLGVAKSGFGEITITKSGDGIAEDQLFVFLVTGITDDGSNLIEFMVSVQGPGSVKITDVPDGTYTITEITEWSWRYNVTDIKVTNGTVSIEDCCGTVSVGALDASPYIDFVNATVNDKWLNGNSEGVKNVAGMPKQAPENTVRFVIDMPRKEELV